MPEDESFSQLVVVGSSAGGIEALSILLAGLPEDFPAPLVIAQHLDPRRIGHLQEILERRSTLPVRTVIDREPLIPGVVYVVPANRHVEITDHHARLLEDAPSHSKPSIDLLLSSASEIFGEGLIAVILTGTGSDGAAGAFAVKEAGGTVVIQDPRTASYPALPLSLAPTIVDVVAQLEDMGVLFKDLLTGAYQLAQSEDPAALSSLLDQLHLRHGIDFGQYKQATILRRLHRRMAATDQKTVNAYARYLQRHPDEYQALISSFLIKVTEFFRDPELYDYLRTQVFPDLLEDSRRRGNELRIWSAGCATGEEAYSLAMLLQELLGDQLEEFRIRIFATDLDSEAIDFARRGIYPASALSALPPDLVQRHFSQIDGEFHVKKHIRSLIIFGQHDLGERAPFPRIDLMMCRNVMIYFTPELQRHVLQIAAFSLRDGGYLALGKAETVSPLAEFFVPDNPQLKIYRRRGDRATLAPARFIETARPLERPALARSATVNLKEARVQRDTPRRSTVREKAESVLLRLPVGVVVVDHEYDIDTINSTARELLGIHSAAIGEDFVHLAHVIPSQPLRAAIDAAIRGEDQPVLENLPVGEAIGGPERWVRITCHPQPLPTDSENERAAVVVIVDVTESVLSRRRDEQRLAELEQSSALAVGQMERLQEVNRDLHRANIELTNLNRDFRSTNEEFQVGNEELQAATEEVETLNEELQATNEELETLNEELQATVEELNTTNEDLQARSVELQQLAVSLEGERRVSDTERARLAAILAGMGDIVLVVDVRGQPILTNPAYEQMFGDPSTGFQVEDSSGNPLPHDQIPQVLAARGETFSISFTATVLDGSRRYFEALGQPIGRDDNLEGGVVVIRDITDRSLRRLQDQFLATASHELRTPLTVLTGYLSLLQRRRIEDERAADFVHLAYQQAQRMEALMRDLLDVARLQGGRLAIATDTVDLGTVIQDTAEIARTLPGGDKIQVEIIDQNLQVRGDARRLEQVLLNLLINSMTHAPDSPKIEVCLRADGDAAEIRVRDTGPGIPAADLPRLFSRFHNSEHPDHVSRGGLGLGLFISRELVEQHGGTIEITSQEGQGVTATVRLPLLSPIESESAQ